MPAPADSSGDASPESILAQTERVLASSHFVRSQALSSFLRFIVQLTVDGKEQELKEYRLGVDVFKRGESFDPRLDPIVRMQAAKLRSRLAEYYSTEGRGDSVVISIPKGGYVPSFTSTAVSAAADKRSIAVLPFVSMSGDPENEYFSDGLTEELINVLAYIPGLRVVARTSVFCFKNTSKDIREIGTQLNVQTVLEGSVRKSGDRLRVTAQLIEVSTGYHLLSRTFPRELKDVFAVQEELASAVVAEIMPHIRTEPIPAARPTATDLSAYELHLKGMFTMAEGFRGPLDCIPIFRRAIEQDPNYGPAWAGLAIAYCVQAWYGMVPSRLAMGLARDASQQAISLDDRLGLGHAVLGTVRAVLDWDWRGSEECLRKAVEVQPGLAITYQFGAFNCFMPQHRFKEGLAWTERALLLNPLDPVLSAGAMFTYGAAGSYDAALNQHSLCRNMHPNHPLSWGAIGITYELQGRIGEAVATLEKAAALSNRAPFPVASLGHLYAKTGNAVEAERILRELSECNAQSWARALIYLGMGDRTECLRWLANGMEEREANLIVVAFDPRFRVLYDDPGFRHLMAKMGLTYFTRR